MCGIAGLFRPDGGPVDVRALRAMTAALAHRGPDGDGFHVEPGVGLGQRRLAIIDPEGGAQPIFNEDGSVAIIFNGMIYNYRELMPELQAAGHVFRTVCDTEVIVHAWEEWGEGCLARLNGFFAFVIWDRNRGTLFMARDRLGKKPLHYAVLPDGGMAFASELCAFDALPELKRRIDPVAVSEYFTWSYVPDPRTIWAGIAKLPAAHALLWKQGEAMPAPVRYWRPATGRMGISEAEALAQFPGFFEDCVGKRLIADVPLGAFLSGGVDSSAVVAVASGLRSRSLDTFTIGFEGQEDETPYARMVAERYGTTQHNDHTTLDYLQGAAGTARIFGEPFGDQSSVPTFAVCALARRFAKVAISGDGGDEVFAGYRRYRWHVLNEAVRKYIPAGMRRSVLGTLARIYPKLDWAPRFLRAKYTLTELSLDSALGYARTLVRSQDDLRAALFSPALSASLVGHDPMAATSALMEESGSEDALVQAQYADIHTYLVGDILTKVDRASMANSLEVRAPLLDYRMVEWGLRLPAELKLRDGSGKYLFKKAMEPMLPNEVLYRPKQGFAATLAPMMRAEAGRIRALLLGPAMLDSGLFQQRTLARLVDEHESGRSDHSLILWLLLVFQGFLADRPAVAAREPVQAAA
jgi:asparagine synthase (glutamine-hydrolysing)